jgi:hypothetical protein
MRPRGFEPLTFGSVVRHFQDFYRIYRALAAAEWAWLA